MATLTHHVSMENVTLQVTLPPALPLRFWLAKRLILLAAWVIGCGIEIETKK